MKEKLNEFLQKSQKQTLLGVGPMSPICVDASIELANEHSVPLFLVASRRQVDGEFIGGGYVNNWSTETFSKYVIDRDHNRNIYLSRDHGGPWQNTVELEKGFDICKAMESAKESYRVDIENGFSIIHIDPSIDKDKTPSVNVVLERAFELYSYCWEVAQRSGKEIIFEVGAEEHGTHDQDLEELEYVLEKLGQFCTNEKIPAPTFIVAQTGTKVMERKNIGVMNTSTDNLPTVSSEMKLEEILGMCKKHNVYLKQHNTDYLDSSILTYMANLGIHAANVAPEFGTIETSAVMDLIEAKNAKSLKDRLVKLVVESGKWKKWMMEGTDACDLERTLIAGHYLFSHPEFKAVKTELQQLYKDQEIDNYIKKKVKQGIYRYMDSFNLTS